MMLRNNSFLVCCFVLPLLFCAIQVRGQKNLVGANTLIQHEGYGDLYNVHKLEKKADCGKAMILIGAPIFIASIFIQDSVGPDAVFLGAECNRMAMSLGVSSLLMIACGEGINYYCKKKISTILSNIRVSVNPNMQGVRICMIF